MRRALPGEAGAVPAGRCRASVAAAMAAVRRTPAGAVVEAAVTVAEVDGPARQERPDAAAAGPVQSAVVAPGHCHRAADWACSPPLPRNHPCRSPISPEVQQPPAMRPAAACARPISAHVYRVFLRRAFHFATQLNRSMKENVAKAWAQCRLKPLHPNVRTAKLKPPGGRSRTHWSRRNRTSSTAPH